MIRSVGKERLNSLIHLRQNKTHLLSLVILQIQGLNQQYDRFMQVYNQYANKDAVRMNSLGNHDYWNGLLAGDAQKRFLEKTGMESIYYHKVVKGYHFLVMSPEDGTTHGYYSDKQINWLKEEIAKAKADDPEKPIFGVLAPTH